MPQMVRIMKAIGRRRLLLFGNFNNGFQPRPRPDHNFTIRHLTTLAPFHSSTTTTRHLNYNYNCKLNCYKYPRRRWFLGCGDGYEGSSLSKLHEERLVIGFRISLFFTHSFIHSFIFICISTLCSPFPSYSPDQIYAVVAAVDLYEDFLPWCQRSDILRRFPDGSFDAELEIGFKFLIESYVSHVVLEKPKMIKTTASESNLFEHLINVWEFSPGPTPDTCSVYFLVDFKFRSPLYRQVASMFFKEVVTRLVSSFIDRCRLIYGPGATIEQKA